MILKGSQRGGGRQLALHLLNATDNEHVRVHELRGFTSEDLEGAFQEAYAISRATKAKRFLYSLSLNPPPDAKVSTEEFEAAIDAAEEKLGLSGQPRAIVFHEKDGRRHAHAVWSRIDAERMRAVPLPFDWNRLRDVSRELFFKHGWKLPPGFVNSKERDPANYTLAEWQQAKRAGIEPKALKAMFAECWSASDSGRAFASALKLRGYTLARGDRRGHIAVDFRGEVYAIARYAGVKTKEVRSRLADLGHLPSVDEAKAEHASRMTEMVRRHIKETEERHARQAKSLAERRAEILDRQREQRERLAKAQEERQAAEAKERQARFARGLRGFWHRITGKHASTKQQNEMEARQAMKRDQAERDRLIFRHIEERNALHRTVKDQRREHTRQITELHRDVAGFDRVKEETRSKARGAFDRESAGRERLTTRGRSRDRDFER